MKNLVFFSVVAVTFLISGCSSRAPMVDTMSEAKTMHHMDEATTNSHGDMDHMAKDGVNTLTQTVDNLNSNIETVYFNFNKFNIRPDMQHVVANDANLINNATPKNFNLRLEGNCDEFGSDEYNYALGLKRAKSVKDSLYSQGVDVSNVKIISYGKTNPVCTEQTKACYAKNRRVNFKFLP